MRKSTLQIIDNRQYLFKQSLVAVVQQFFLLAPYPLAIVFQEELLNYGNKALLEEILPVIDNLERALAHASEDGLGGVVEGIRMTHTMLLMALKKFNVTPIEAVGAPFDS